MTSLVAFNFDLCTHCYLTLTKVPRGVVADEPYSDSQGSYREVWARRRDSEIVV